MQVLGPFQDQVLQPLALLLADLQVLAGVLELLQLLDPPSSSSILVLMLLSFFISG